MPVPGASLADAPSVGLPEAGVPVAGVDEAGRGCLAGPVAAAAVVLPERWDLTGLTDSTRLSAAQREALEGAIKAQAVAWGVGLVWPREIDALNILRASLRAMGKAVAVLGTRPALLLVDGNQPMPTDIPQRTIVDGDLLEPAISAASILAKTFRDRLMTRLDRRFPGYGFARHKGYGTKAHLEALRRLGPCDQHRRSFKGVLPARERELWLPGI